MGGDVVASVVGTSVVVGASVVVIPVMSKVRKLIFVISVNHKNKMTKIIVFA